MKWIPVEQELPEDFQTVIISGECNGLRAVNISFRMDNKWVKPYDWQPWKVNVEAWMPMPRIYKPSTARDRKNRRKGND